MPRTARIAPHEHIYHVLCRGNNRQTIFKRDDDYERYMAILGKYKEKFSFKLFHYVLMTNHVHLVLESTADGGSLADIMKGINLSYAQYFKGRYNQSGHFWQDRYKSIIVSEDDYLLACGGYVELNPVRARIVDDPKDYRWSSYRAYAYGRSDITDAHPIYENLGADQGERRKKYRELVKGMLLEENALKGAMSGRIIYGNETFTGTMTKKYKVGAMIRPKGRPRKEEQ